MVFRFVILSLGLLIASIDSTNGQNTNIPDFRRAKKILPVVFKGFERTLYCRCPYQGKKVDLKSCGFKSMQPSRRSQRIEWEHVVPAEAFGQSFVEWRIGDPKCKTKKRVYKGRRCAEKNAQFSKMEADLYNLFPEIGEVNAARSNFSMAEVDGFGKFLGLTFGECRAKVFNRKFEPMDFAKGIVARTYLYMEQAYPGHGIVSEKNRKLFEAWDRAHPVTSEECEIYQRKKEAQRSPNPVLEVRCQSIVDKKPGKSFK